jgi:hypothetical protein
MEGSIESIPSRKHKSTLSSHHPTRYVAVRGSNRDQGHAGRRQQQQLNDTHANLKGVLPKGIPCPSKEIARPRLQTGQERGEERGGAQAAGSGREQKLTTQVLLKRKSKYPTVKNKLFIHDLSDIQIQHVNSKTVTFQQNLRIRGLRSTIRATVQKVNFLSTP